VRLEQAIPFYRKGLQLCEPGEALFRKQVEDQLARMGGGSGRGFEPNCGLILVASCSRLLQRAPAPCPSRAAGRISKSKIGRIQPRFQSERASAVKLPARARRGA
jgi:hypothetical protein